MHTRTNTQPDFNNQMPFMECAKKNKQLVQEKKDLQDQLAISQEKVAELQAQIDAMNAPTPPTDETQIEDANVVVTPSTEDVGVHAAGLDGLGSGA